MLYYIQILIQTPLTFSYFFIYAATSALQLNYVNHVWWLTDACSYHNLQSFQFLLLWHY